MKVFISADMEGVGTVVHRDDVNVDDPGGHHFALAREQFTAEVNAAVGAAFAAGATEVVVNDSHGNMRTLLPTGLDPRARLVRGPVKPGLMMAGLGEGFSAALLIGYHSRAGRAGVLSHTLSGAALFEVSLDGEPIGEIGLSVLAAAEAGVPVVFVPGDEHACLEASALLPEVRTFSTKAALDRITASCLSPQECVEGIDRGVAEALTGELATPVTVDGGHTLSATFLSATAATLASWIPGVRLTDARTVEFDCESITAGIDLLVVMLFAAHGAADA